METTSAFTTLSLLQKNPHFVALLSVDVAQFCTRFGMTRILPLQLHTRSEPYQLVTRHGTSSPRWRGCSSTTLRTVAPQRQRRRTDKQKALPQERFALSSRRRRITCSAAA
jgi:transcription initiation factor TFIID subunit TAF12